MRGIVRAHGGVLQTHEVPGMSGSAYVLEVPLGAGSGTVMPPAPEPEPEPAPEPMAGQAAPGGGRRRARRASTDAFLESPVGGSEGSGDGDTAAAEPTGRRRARREPAAQGSQETQGAQSAHSPHEIIPAQQSEGSGRRRGRPSPAETGAQHSLPAQLSQLPEQAQGQGQRPGQPAVEQQGPGQALALPAAPAPSEGAVVTAAEGAQGGGGRPQRGQTVPPQGVPAETPMPVPAGGHRARQGGENQLALPSSASASAPAAEGFPQAGDGSASAPQPTGRRARRALAAVQERSAQAEPTGPRTAFALPPADADRTPPAAVDADASLPGRHDAVRLAPDDSHTPPQAHSAASGQRRARRADAPQQAGPAVGQPAEQQPVQSGGWAENGSSGQGPAAPTTPGEQADDRVDGHPGDHPGSRSGGEPERPAAGHTTHTTGTTAVAGTTDATGIAESRPRDIAPVADARRQPLPAEAPMPGGSSDSTQGRAFSVRTLGQGVPFAQHIAHQQNQTLGGAGRRRKLAAPPEGERTPQSAPSQSAAAQGQGPGSGQLLSAPEAEGRAYAIGAPDEGAEGPEPLDGPGGAVEVANRPSPQPVDDELPPEPLDNPRRLLVWPAPDVSTQQALSDRGYRPVIVHSREEVDAQIAAFPAALFVDPLTGPITRKALQSLRQAAVAAEVPVLVTAGLGQASREAAYGADPAVLLKALAPRDSEQHPPRVLLIEEHEEIALALTETLERRGMQVARASTDNEAVALATRMRPNLVVMDLMQVRRRRAGIVDWLRANGQLNRTPLVVYTSADMTGSELPKLSSGEAVLFLAERSTSDEVQSRIVDLLAKIGTN